MSSKETAEIVRAARAVGWDVETDGSNHVRITPPNGGAVTLATTPSDVRAYRNNILQLRRMGLDVVSGEEIDTDCEHSWHRDGVGGRQCPRCRRTWRVIDLPAPPAPVDAVDAGMDGLALYDRVQSAISRSASSEDPMERVRTLFESLGGGEFLSTGEIHGHLGEPAVEKEELRILLRRLLDEGAVTQSRKGRYGRGPGHVPAPEPVRPKRRPEPKPEAEMPKHTDHADDVSSPPDPTRPWMWEPNTGWVEFPFRSTVGPIYEFLGHDSKGRLLLRDDTGDLFCAVPMTPQF